MLVHIHGQLFGGPIVNGQQCHIMTGRYAGSDGAHLRLGAIKLPKAT